MATSSSSSPSNLFAVWLYDSQGINRIALVDIPTDINFPQLTQDGQPPILTYLGNYYFWSLVKARYCQVTPYAAALDNGQPLASVLANPQP